MPKNTTRRYLLRGVIRCGIDGITYSGTAGRDGVGWYRCGGQVVDRGPLPGRCWGQSIRMDAIEPVVWADIEAWLRSPSDLLEDLEADEAGGDRPLFVEASLLAKRLDGLQADRRRAVHLAVQGYLNESDVRPELDRIDRERGDVAARIAELEATTSEPVAPQPPDLAARIRERVDAGLSDEDRSEIVRHLIRIEIETKMKSDGKKHAVARIEYRFPMADERVVPTLTDRRSSPPRAGSGRGRSSAGRGAELHACRARRVPVPTRDPVQRDG